jgi:hypothetical protein
MLLVTILLIPLLLQSAERERRLTMESIRILVLNTPEGIALEQRGGCPFIDIVEWSSELLSVQLRNSCPKGSSGLAGTFYVDRFKGLIWAEPDSTGAIDSDRLRLLRALLLGHVPSYVSSASAKKRPK